MLKEVLIPLPEQVDCSPEQNNINHPSHYNLHPKGIECIDVVEEMSFNLGNAIKYIWRAGLKGNKIEDLRKAIWYLNREIGRIENDSNNCK